jgi:REP element-mobilizing transposase RayT
MLPPLRRLALPTLPLASATLKRRGVCSFICKEFSLEVNRFYNKPVFWTANYFVASCGGVTLEQLKTYVEKHSSPAS